jgi:Tfp pilus assembly protein PilV
MDDNNVYVTITWPAETDGNQIYTGEYTYARPEYGEADQSYAVEAYTKADYPYSESVHATATIPVPAKEQVVPVEDNIYVKFDGTELPVGKKIIFVYENGENSYAFGPIASGKGNPVSVVVENNEVNIANTDVIEFTVGGGDVAFSTYIKTYTLEYTDGYLAYNSSTNFKTLTSIGQYDSDAYWRLQSVTGGYALNNNASTNRYIRKHATSNKFGPYAVNNDSEVVVIYIEKSDTPEPVAPNAPVITFAGEETTQMTVTVTAEEGCTLIVNGEAIESNTYTYTVDREDIYTEGTVNVSAYAVKDGVQSEEATGSKAFVVEERPIADEPVIQFVETKEGNIVTEVEVVVTDATSHTVYVNGAQLRGADASAVSAGGRARHGGARRAGRGAGRQRISRFYAAGGAESGLRVHGRRIVPIPGQDGNLPQTAEILQQDTDAGQQPVLPLCG